MNDPASLLTVRAAVELIGHEAIVQEWYRDSEGIGTWGIGVTNRSGHNVDRYKDNPQTIDRCVEVYLWLLRNRYIPDVLHAFDGFPLSETQFAAALSWHYNTGHILASDWVGLVKQGHPTAARNFMLSHYLNGGDLSSRRKAEADLFFDGHWSGDGMVTVWPVKKPAYRPDWAHGARINITPAVTHAMAGAMA